MESYNDGLGRASADNTGKVIGNWQLCRMLGQGGYGTVYEAKNLTIAGHRAAVKILHPWLSLQAEVYQRFINEASAASRAAHENIVQVFDGGVTPTGVCYLVMEFLAGRSLAEVLKEGAMEIDRVVNLGCQIASALQSAHDLFIVHRDLKPDNLFVTQRASNPEFLKVLDFGVAKLRSMTEEASRTKTGALLGTPKYMSPEQWGSAPDIDGRSDIYALGVILFECVTGSSPFFADSLFGYMNAHVMQAPPDPALLRPMPALLRDLILSMLQKRREDRPQTMAAVKAALEALNSDERSSLKAGATQLPPMMPPNLASAHSLKGSTSELTAPNPSGLRWEMAILPGMGVLLIGLGLWGWSSSDQSGVSASMTTQVAPSDAVPLSTPVTGRSLDLGLALRDERAGESELVKAATALTIDVEVPEIIKANDVIRMVVKPSPEAYVLVLYQEESGSFELLWPQGLRSASRFSVAHPLKLPPLRAALRKGSTISHERLLVYAFTDQEENARALNASQYRSVAILDELLRDLPNARSARWEVRYDIRKR